MGLSFISMTLWSAAAFIAWTTFFVWASEFLWYIMCGTIYDRMPWLFSFFSAGDFVISPFYNTNTNNNVGLGSLDENQVTAVYDLLLFAIVMTFFAAKTTTTPILFANSALEKKAIVSNATTRLLHSLRRAKAAHKASKTRSA